MKVIFFLLFIGFIANAQDFNGNYTSDFTSFKDNQNPDTNFQETSKFNITIIFEDKDKGSIAIQDPRIPEKILIYKVEQFLDKIERKETVYNIYQGISQHTQDPIQTKVIIYLNKDGELNLMVSDNESSQVFHGIKK